MGTLGAPAGSSVLFLATCSLTKQGGGKHYNEENGAAVSHAASAPGRRLLERRDEIRRSVKENRALAWQGVPLADLEFNRGLAKGQDFGGSRRALYLPAIDRYRGRFYQALGENGRQALGAPGRNTLIVSGLYGLLRPTESIQVYSCPLSAEVAEIWSRDSLLTELLSDYIARQGILRVFDLLAVDAYRKLIDWQGIKDSGTDVLHCFDAMASGESALTALGMTLASDLLNRTEDELIGIEDGDRIGTVVFRSLPASPQGYPDELTPLMAARNESRIWQPQYPDENLPVVLRGGNPESSPIGQQNEEGLWNFTLSREFGRELRNQPQLLKPVVDAIFEVCKAPTSAQKNFKPMQGRLRGMWRYRIGDYRIVYEPNSKKRTIDFLWLKPRSSAYE